MNCTEDQTRAKILHAALALFAEQGIQKTSVHDVAYHAGVTRVTVYRYFPEKKALVRETLLSVEQIFQNGLDALEHDPQAEWEHVMDQIGVELRALPRSDVFARFDEVKRLYPDVYRDIQDMRAATLNGIFEHFVAGVTRQGLLRPGLNRSLVQALFWEMIVNVFDTTRFQSLGLSDGELYDSIKDILLHGILSSEPTSGKAETYDY